MIIFVFLDGRLYLTESPSLSKYKFEIIAYNSIAASSMNGNIHKSSILKVSVTVNKEITDDYEAKNDEDDDDDDDDNNGNEDNINKKEVVLHRSRRSVIEFLFILSIIFIF